MFLLILHKRGHRTLQLISRFIFVMLVNNPQRGPERVERNLSYLINHNRIKLKNITDGIRRAASIQPLLILSFLPKRNSCGLISAIRTCLRDRSQWQEFSAVKIFFPHAEALTSKTKYSR